MWACDMNPPFTATSQASCHTLHPLELVSRWATSMPYALLQICDLMLLTGVWVQTVNIMTTEPLAMGKKMSVLPQQTSRNLQHFAIIEVKIPYEGDGRIDIERNDTRIRELLVQAGGYFTRVNEQPNALREAGGHVRVFVTYGKYYSEVTGTFNQRRGKWFATGFKPWLHIFEQSHGIHRPLFHVIAELVGQYWYA
ncbi:hypothetical protein GGX14DRAFT_446568 [Mycena pura]|uniref:Uncharacterized protein n=1 Tax=Mycena pura TaxID=153505 RepID=A0AAD6VGW8_9AGAR|nr:hypothetical protein GGX14DRAFT_446568 [Mycena pura]